MTRPTVTRAPKLKDLSQQKTDFTAEGSPPPGQVSKGLPATRHKARKALPRRAPAAGRG